MRPKGARLPPGTAARPSPVARRMAPMSLLEPPPERDAPVRPSDAVPTAATPGIEPEPQAPVAGAAPEHRPTPTPTRSFILQGVAWIALYLLLAVAPLLIILVGPVPPGRDLGTELSAGLGFVGLAMMCLTFVIVARFKQVKAPYGSDIVYHFHREISIIAVGLIVLHPLILLAIRFGMVQEEGAGFLLGSPVFWTGTAALLALVVIVGSSIWRRRLSLEYDTWRRVHGALSVGAVLVAVSHVALVGHYLDTPAKQALWLGYTLAWIALIVHVRLVRPWLQSRARFVVDEVRAERGGAWTLALRPAGHPGFRFQPGQFAWLTLWSSPYSDREHPFSISSSAERPDRVEFTIKALGDFSSRIREAQPGQPAYLDGPHGALSVDRHAEATGFVFVAGGIGITPFMSQLRTMADRGDRRRVILFYSNRSWDDVTFREELEELRGRLDLEVVHVLSAPPPDWTGERGRLNAEILARHLPAERSGLECFVCGPPMMMDATERALLDAGVPLGRIDSERFNLV